MSEREQMQDKIAELRTFLSDMHRDASDAEDPQLHGYARAIEGYLDELAALAAAPSPAAQDALTEKEIQSVLYHGRTMVNFSHVPSVTRAIDWLSQDFVKALEEKRPASPSGVQLNPRGWGKDGKLEAWCENCARGDHYATPEGHLPPITASERPAAQEEPCGTAETATTSTNEDTHHTANHASPSVGHHGQLLKEWESLSKESQEKVAKWFNLAVERLQLILDGASERPAESAPTKDTTK